MIPDDNRAVSIAVTHALTIAITTVLISGLLISSGELLDDQEERVSQSQFDEIGADVISLINSLDRLNGTGDDVNVSVDPSYPEEVAGHSWKMNLSGGGENPFNTTHALNITSDNFDRTIQYPLNTTNANVDVGATTSNSDPEIWLCDDGTITFGDCS
jgi:hypothetical protein